MRALLLAARAAGIALLVTGALLILKECFRDDRQRTLVRGSVSTVQDRPKYAPGWGLLSLAAGAGLIVWSRRSLERRADERDPRERL